MARQIFFRLNCLMTFTPLYATIFLMDSVVAACNAGDGVGPCEPVEKCRLITSTETYDNLENLSNSLQPQTSI